LRGIVISVLHHAERVHRVVQVVIDTLQTLPSFVYLIAVVMLFRLGDFSAMIAIIRDRLINTRSYRKNRELGIL